MVCTKKLLDERNILYICSANDVLNHFQSVNINTVGDLARLSLNQIEMDPVLSSKSANLRRALTFYQERLIASSSTNTIDCSLTVCTTITSDESMSM